MAKPVVWILIGLAVVAALAGAWLTVGDRLLPGMARMMEGNADYERSFNESFEAAMRRECVANATTTAKGLGRSGPEVDAEIQRRCNCAIEVVRPMPVSEKAELGADSEKQAKVMAEITRRCIGN